MLRWSVCRSQLLYLSCHGCMLMDDALCNGLDSCVALDLANTPVSDAGLQSLLAKVCSASSHVSMHKLA